MKRLFLLAALCLSLPFCALAQTDGSRKGEKQKALSGEAYLGIGAPMYSVGSSGHSPRLMAGFELRYRFAGSPWDVGFGSRAGMMSRTYPGGVSAGTHPLYVSSEHYFVADYNCRINPSLVFFAGLEAGLSVSYDLSEYNRFHSGLANFEVDTSMHYAPKRLSPYVSPRIGIEVWDRLRCTFGYDLSDKGNRNLNFRVGYVF